MNSHDDTRPGEMTDTQLDQLLAAANRELLGHIETTADPHRALTAIMIGSTQEAPPSETATPAISHDPDRHPAIGMITIRLRARDLVLDLDSTSDIMLNGVPPRGLSRHYGSHHDLVVSRDRRRIFAIARDRRDARDRSRTLGIDKDPDNDPEKDLALDYERSSTWDLATGATDRTLLRDMAQDIARDRRRTRDLDSGLARDVDSVRDIARDIARDIDLVHARAHGRALGRASDLARNLASELDSALDHVLAYDLARDHDIARDFAHARALAQDLTHDIGFVLSSALSLAVELARDLDAQQVDASGADLSTLEIKHLDALDRTIWTRQTTWPPSIADQVEARSEEIRPGVYQIHFGNTSDRHALTLV